MTGSRLTDRGSSDYAGEHPRLKSTHGDIMSL